MAAYVSALLLILYHTWLVEASTRPHIIFVLVDDLGWYDVGFHGSSQIPTPNIDALAYDGIILNNYYVHYVCTPTRSAIMTGRYPIHTGLQQGVPLAGQPFGLGLDNKLLPQYLKEIGYTNHMIGKWHLGAFTNSHIPTSRGFDSFYGFLNGASEYWKHTVTRGYGLDGQEVNPSDSGKEPNKLYTGLDFWDNTTLVWNETGKYSTHLYTKRAVEIIENHDPEQPMFMYFPHQGVHSAVGGPAMEAPDEYIAKLKYIKQERRRIYAAMTTIVDESIGNVTQALKNKGMLENSIIVFSTDNGGPPNGLQGAGSSNWPLRGTKGSLWEGGTKAAGFVWSPLFKNSGYVSNLMMHCTDWVPTLLNAAGYDLTKLPKQLDGFNAWEELSQAKKDSPRKDVLYNIDNDSKSQPAAIKVGDMKLVHGSYWGGSDWYAPPEVQLEGHNFDYDDSTQKHKEMNYVSQIRTSQSSIALNAIGRHIPSPHPVVVVCGVKPANASTNCDPVKSPCLFNVTADPCEYTNLAHQYPEILTQLDAKLQEYNRTVVPACNKPFDPRSDPKYHDGAWVPWLE